MSVNELKQRNGFPPNSGTEPEPNPTRGDGCSDVSYLDQQGPRTGQVYFWDDISGLFDLAVSICCFL